MAEEDIVSVDDLSDDASSTTSEERAFADLFFNMSEEMPASLEASTARDDTINPLLLPVEGTSTEEDRMHVLQAAFAQDPEQALMADVGPQDASSPLHSAAPPPAQADFFVDDLNPAMLSNDSMKDATANQLEAKESMPPKRQMNIRPEKNTMAQLLRSQLGLANKSSDQTPEIPFDLKDTDDSIAELDEFVMFSEQERLQEAQSTFNTAFETYCGQCIFLNSRHVCLLLRLTKQIWVGLMPRMTNNATMCIT